MTSALNSLIKEKKQQIKKLRPDISTQEAEIIIMTAISLQLNNDKAIEDAAESLTSVLAKRI